MSGKMRLDFETNEQACGALNCIGFYAACMKEGVKPIVPDVYNMKNYPRSDNGILPIGHLSGKGTVAFDVNSCMESLEPFRDSIREIHRKVSSGEVFVIYPQIFEQNYRI